MRLDKGYLRFLFFSLSLSFLYFPSFSFFSPPFFANSFFSSSSCLFTFGQEDPLVVPILFVHYYFCIVACGAF
ncbi:hypothetical protein QBC38DRAFT_251205 [Podospora fimiseda]|uniref:Uncharacterized protein n=1 Tax=Podospora fimiseda TaxID=252190 RepID=A0AAN7GSD4_9PEZI|nr:hypothetical protein QBC38DRAFT_251205 [Podospora fimiseda]